MPRKEQDGIRTRSRSRLTLCASPQGGYALSPHLPPRTRTRRRWERMDLPRTGQAGPRSEKMTPATERRPRLGTALPGGQTMPARRDPLPHTKSPVPESPPRPAQPASPRPDLRSARKAAGSTSGSSISAEVVAMPPLNIASKTALPAARTKR